MTRRVERDVDRVLTHLRRLMREQEFTQIDVQNVLGWGRSYISQLLTKQKTIRVEQVLLILNVIGVSPEEFWGEIYQFAGPYKRRHPADPPTPRGANDATADAVLAEIRQLFYITVKQLKKRSVISDADLERAIDEVKAFEGGWR